MYTLILLYYIEAEHVGQTTFIDVKIIRVQLVLLKFHELPFISHSNSNYSTIRKKVLETKYAVFNCNILFPFGKLGKCYGNKGV